MAEKARLALVILAVSSFVLLGALDLVSGLWRTGLASVMLGTANFLLLYLQ